MICVVCDTALNGRQTKFCSTTCKRVKHNKTYQAYARQEHRGYERKLEFLALKGGACQKCGYSKSIKALEFHHREGEVKLFTLDVRNLSNRSTKRCLEELAKCDLLCANCHREYHDRYGETWYRKADGHS